MMVRAREVIVGCPRWPVKQHDRIRVKKVKVELSVKVTLELQLGFGVDVLGIDDGLIVPWCRDRDGPSRTILENKIPCSCMILDELIVTG